MVSEEMHEVLGSEGYEVVILGGEFYNTLAVARALGRRGVRVSVGGDTRNSLSFSSRYVRNTFIHPPFKGGKSGVRDALWNHCVSIRNEGRVPFLFPTGDSQLEMFLDYRSDFESIARVHLPSTESLKAIMDKTEQYRVAEQLGIPIPATWSNRTTDRLQSALKSGEVEFPLFFKMRGTDAIDSQSCCVHRSILNGWGDWDAVVRPTEKAGIGFVIQEIVPGGDDCLYTVGLCRSESGEICGSFSGRKLRQFPPGFGICRIGETVPRNITAEYAENLLGAFNFFGIAQVEFKLHMTRKKFYLMEVNPRSWSWIELACATGVNLPMLYFEDGIGERVEVGVAEQKVGKRFWVCAELDMLAAIVYGDGLPMAPVIARFFRLKESIFALDDPAPCLMYLPRCVLGLTKAVLKRVARFLSSCWRNLQHKRRKQRK